MSSEMASQQTLDSLSEIFDEMKPVCALNGLGRAFSGSRGVFASTVSTDRHQIGMLAHPGGCGVCFPIRQQVYHTVTLQVDKNRSEAVATEKRKIVYPQKEDRSGKRIGEIHDAAQDRLASRLYSQASCESGTSFATDRQPNGG